MGSVHNHCLAASWEWWLSLLLSYQMQARLVHFQSSTWDRWASLRIKHGLRKHHLASPTLLIPTTLVLSR